MADKGLKSYQGEVSSNISLVGSGFKVISEVGEAGGPTYTEATFSGPYCVAIKNISSTTVQVQAQSIEADDFTKGSSYSKTTGTNYIGLTFGDIIYGKFDKVAIEEPSTLITQSIQLIKGGQ